MGRDLALLVALHEEASGILKVGHWKKIPSSAYPAIYKSCVGGAQAILVVSGMGRARADRSTREVLEEYGADAVLSLGFAGGLVRGQRAGDLIVAHTLMPAPIPLNGQEDPRRAEPFTSDPALTDESLRVAAGLGLRHRAGICVTASEIVSSFTAKTRLRLATGALAVDMESLWIGLACREWNVPFLAVRSVVDVAERPLPAFAARLVSDNGPRDRWRQALRIMLRPSSIPALIRLRAAALIARESLAAFAVGFISSRTLCETEILS